MKLTKRNIFFCFAVIVMVTGCQSTKKNVEMPYDAEDHDALRPSPCACVEYTEYYEQFSYLSVQV